MIYKYTVSEQAHSALIPSIIYNAPAANWQMAEGIELLSSQQGSISSGGNRSSSSSSSSSSGSSRSSSRHNSSSSSSSSGSDRSSEIGSCSDNRKSYSISRFTFLGIALTIVFLVGLAYSNQYEAEAAEISRKLRQVWRHLIEYCDLNIFTYRPVKKYLPLPELNRRYFINMRLSTKSRNRRWRSCRGGTELWVTYFEVWFDQFDRNVTVSELNITNRYRLIFIIKSPRMFFKFYAAGRCYAATKGSATATIDIAGRCAYFSSIHVCCSPILEWPLLSLLHIPVRLQSSSWASFLSWSPQLVCL